MRKIKQKTKSKSTLKLLREYMQTRYVEILRYLNSDAENAEQNVLYLIDNEPKFFAEIMQLKEAQELKKKKQKFNLIDMSQTEIERYSKQLQVDKLKIVDSINHELEKQSTSDTALKQRTTHIVRLQSKLDEIIAIQDSLAELLEAEKRPVGRPRKQTEEILDESFKEEQ